MSTYERLVNSQNFFSPYLTQEDLSRFGRNYLDAGEYIEKIFPFLGVRFIAVNDNYDSFGGKNASDELVIPFKNLINEAYCRDISVKVRTQLEVKRKSGQYIGAFAVYGYLKDEANKARHKAGKRMGNRFGRPRSYH